MYQYSRSDFFRLARQVSGNDTVHYDYSMNWALQVKGTFTFAMDYLTECLNGLFKAAENVIDLWYTLTGVKGKICIL